MENFNPELLEKAKQTKSVEELLALAKENGVEMSEAQAKAYYAQLHPVSGELSDDELDNVAGGGCAAGDGRLVVTLGYKCSGFTCKNCGNNDFKWILMGMSAETTLALCKNCGEVADCGHCKYCTYEKGLWLCNHEKNRK